MCVTAAACLSSSRAKRRRCNDAYVGTLSSYAYVLMCISHLQARSPPVLPVLQEMEPTHRRTIGAWFDSCHCTCCMCLNLALSCRCTGWTPC